MASETQGNGGGVSGGGGVGGGGGAGGASSTVMVHYSDPLAELVSAIKKEFGVEVHERQLALWLTLHWRKLSQCAHMIHQQEKTNA